MQRLAGRADQLFADSEVAEVGSRGRPRWETLRLKLASSIYEPLQVRQAAHQPEISVVPLVAAANGESSQVVQTRHISEDSRPIHERIEAD